MRTVIEYGVNGYPLINFLKKEEEAAKRNQLLVSSSRDYVISNDGNQVNFCVLHCHAGSILVVLFALNL